MSGSTQNTQVQGLGVNDDSPMEPITPGIAAPLDHLNLNDGDTGNDNSHDANTGNNNNTAINNANNTTTDGNANASTATQATLSGTWPAIPEDADEQDNQTQYTTHYKPKADVRDPFDMTYDPKKGTVQDMFRDQIAMREKVRAYEHKMKRKSERKKMKRGDYGVGGGNDDNDSDPDGSDSDSDSDNVSLASTTASQLHRRSVAERTKHFQNLTDLFQRRILETLPIHTQSKLTTQTRWVFERYGKWGSGDRLRVNVDGFLKGEVVGSETGKMHTGGMGRESQMGKRKRDPVSSEPGPTTTNSPSDADGHATVKPGFEHAVGDALRIGSGGGLGRIIRPDITTHVPDMPSTSSFMSENLPKSRPTTKLRLRVWPDLEAMKVAGGLDDREVVEAMLIDAADVVEDEVNEDWDEDDLENYDDNEDMEGTVGDGLEEGGHHDVRMMNDVMLGMEMAEKTKANMKEAGGGDGGGRWFKSINPTPVKNSHNNTKADTSTPASTTKSNVTNHTPTTLRTTPRSNDLLTTHHLVPHHPIYSPFHPLDVSCRFPHGLKLPLSYLSFLNTVHALYNTYALALLRHHTTKYGPEPIFRPGIRDLLRFELDDIITPMSRETLGLDLGRERRQFLREVNARTCGGGKYASGNASGVRLRPRSVQGVTTTTNLATGGLTGPANAPFDATYNTLNVDVLPNANAHTAIEDIEIELAVAGGREGNGILNPAERRILGNALGMLDEEVEEVWADMEGKRHGRNVGAMRRVMAAKEVERLRREKARERVREEIRERERAVEAEWIGEGGGGGAKRGLRRMPGPEMGRFYVGKKIKKARSEEEHEFLASVRELGKGEWMDID